MFGYSEPPFLPNQSSHNEDVAAASDEALRGKTRLQCFHHLQDGRIRLVVHMGHVTNRFESQITSYIFFIFNYVWFDAKVVNPQPLASVHCDSVSPAFRWILALSNHIFVGSVEVNCFSDSRTHQHRSWIHTIQHHLERCPCDELPSTRLFGPRLGPTTHAAPSASTC